MAKQLEEGRLRSVWNSLFNEAELSSCKENDADLQGVSMLLKKTFSVFEKLKERCEEAESVQRRPCQRCASLEKVIRGHETKLKQTESRMKSIAQILNMGGLSQDKNASPGKQQSMAKALTQMLFCEDMQISEDESETEERSAKRKRCGTRSPVKVMVNKSPVKVKDNEVLVSETLPVLTTNTDCVQTKHVVLESLCSQTTAPTDVVFLSDSEETCLDLSANVNAMTPTKRNVPQGASKTSPVIRSKKTRPKLDRVHLNRSFEKRTQEEGNSLLATSSPPLAGGLGCKKPPFTPKLRVRRDIHATTNDVVELVSTPESDKVDSISKEALPPKLVPPPPIRSPSLLTTTHLLSTARLRLKLKPVEPSDSTPDFGRVVSTGNTEVDNILDIMCDTKASDVPGSDVPAARRQADFWKLKPSSSSKEPITLLNGPKLKQTKIAFGVHPEKTDVCTLSEFNGGVRLSQPSLDATLREFNGGARQSQRLLDATLREFNGGLRPSLTSTMLPLEMSPEFTDEAAFEQAILDSLRDTNTQLGPEEDEDFVSPSPNVSLSKRLGASEKAKERGRSEALDLKENTRVAADEMPDTEDLLEAMGLPDPLVPHPPVRAANLMRDFDWVPKKNDDNEPDHKYKREAVRKRDERMKLEGWDCADCKKYYAARVNNTAERKQLMDRCSKHRDKYQRNESPPDYWNPEFPSTLELRARNLDVTQKAPQFRSKKRL